MCQSFSARHRRHGDSFPLKTQHPPSLILPSSPTLMPEHFAISTRSPRAALGPPFTGKGQALLLLPGDKGQQGPRRRLRSLTAAQMPRGHTQPPPQGTSLNMHWRNRGGHWPRDHWYLRRKKYTSASTLYLEVGNYFKMEEKWKLTTGIKLVLSCSRIILPTLRTRRRAAGLTENWDPWAREGRGGRQRDAAPFLASSICFHDDAILLPQTGSY